MRDGGDYGCAGGGIGADDGRANVEHVPGGETGAGEFVVFLGEAGAVDRGGGRGDEIRTGDVPSFSPR